MDVPPRDDPQVVTYKIPKIEVYQVTEDELIHIEEGYGQVGQDLTIAVASASLGVGFLIPILTLQLSHWLKLLFIAVVILFGIVFVHSGTKWSEKRKIVPGVIAKIRSRKVNPEVTPRS